MNTLQDAAKKGRASLAAATAASIQTTLQTAEHKAEEVSRAESRSVDQVRDHVRSSRQVVSHALDEHAEAVRAAASREQETLRGGHAQLSSHAQAEVSKHQEAVTAAGAQHAAEVQDAGARAALATQSSLTSASTEARQQPSAGGDERSSGRAQVASRLGNDASSQIQSAGPENENHLHEHANDAAQSLTSHAAQAATAIGSAGPMLQEHLDQTVAGAAGELGRAEQRSIASLNTGAESAHEQLNTVESRAVEQTQRAAASRREQLHSAATAAVSGIRRQAEKTDELGQRQLNDSATQLAKSSVDERQAGALAPELQSHISKAYATTAAQAHDLEGQVNRHLTTEAQEGTSALSRIPTQVGPNLASANQAVTTEMTRVSSGTEAALRRSADATIAGSNEAVAQAGAHLDQAANQAKAGFATATSAVGHSLNEAAGEIGHKATEALSGLHGRIAEGQSRVDGFVAEKGRRGLLTVQRSILGAIGSWFADQFRDLWDMLSSPSFWVGLIVTIVLLPVLGPGALIVGGAVGGAVAGIEQNIREGRSWYDWRNILRNAVIGAAAGALMALGIAAIVAAGLEGLAATVAVMALSAVIGIVVNLVNGERWDKGLLANLFLAWLFQRILGARARGGRGSETVPPEGETPAGGRTTTRVPGLYEGVDPNYKPTGWDFQDTISRGSGETQVTTRVTAPDGSTGRMVRGLNPATGEFLLHYADLESIPRGLRWIQTDPPMTERGTPLEAYMTMRQMRILEGQTGRSLIVTTPRTVRLTTILNERTIAQLARAVPRTTPPNAALDQAILNTHSVQYANNSVIQSGGRIAGAHIEGGSLVPASNAGFNGISPQLMADYGLTPSTPVLNGFDIVLDVVPANAPQAPPRPPAPLAPPIVPVPGRDDRESH